MTAWTFSLWLASIAAACVVGTYWERRKQRKAQAEQFAAMDRHWNESAADFEEAVRRAREAERFASKPAAPGNASVHELPISGTVSAGKEPA